jgi:site-specific DNA recombinase
MSNTAGSFASPESSKGDRRRSAPISVVGTAPQHRRFPLEDLRIWRRSCSPLPGTLQPLLDAIGRESASGQSQWVDRGRQLADELAAQAPDQVKATLMALRCRVDINPDRIDINLSRGRLAELLAGQPNDPAMREDRLDHTSDDAVTLTVPARLKRVGREMRMLIESSDDSTAADPSLLRIVARAHDIQARLI